MFWTGLPAFLNSPEVPRVPVDKTKFAAGAILEDAGSDAVGLENTAESVSKQWGMQSNLEVMLSRGQCRK